MVTGEPIQIELREGSSAIDLLSDEAFGRQWDALHVACPWATALQTRAFAEIWYSVYGPAFEPLLVLAFDEAGELTGLLALAVNRSGGGLVPVGAHQAEYQVWLSEAGGGDAFIEAALDRLALRFPGGRLKLRWLPSGAPLGWLNPTHPWAARARFEALPRPLMTVGEGSTVESSLRKKQNKHRLTRLRELGPVRVEVLRSRAEIEPIFDQLVDFCEFRNGARYECLPFREDPYKREFYLRLVDAPEIIHTSVLWAGNTLLAANIGGREDTSVQIGLVTQSPFVSKYSPGKLLFLLLGRELGNAGFRELDLTPSEDLNYKERFADHFDTVHTGTIFFHERAARLYDRKRQAVRALKSCLGILRLTPGTIRLRLGELKRKLRARAPHVMVLHTVTWVLRQLWSRSRLNIYQMGSEDAARIEGSPLFNRDSLKDLLQYEPSSPARPSKFEFLREAFTRLEAGGHVFTLAKGGQLLHFAWVSPVTGPIETELGRPLELPPDSVLLWDDYTHPTLAHEELYLSSLGTRLQEAGPMAIGDGRIFISLPHKHQAACQAMDRVGFQPHATLTRRILLGLKTWKWHIE